MSLVCLKGLLGMMVAGKFENTRNEEMGSEKERFWVVRDVFVGRHSPQPLSCFGVITIFH